MKRSEINFLVRDATQCFLEHGWTLPPNPRWDVTDFGLGDWTVSGLVLVNLADEAEYCEKLMYAKQGMSTPLHCHRKKKEDIICRWGALQVRLDLHQPTILRINGEPVQFIGAAILALQSGERLTIEPGIVHEFAPLSEECIIGEVSTANDDLNDNFFTNPEVGRYPGIEEDEPAMIRLVSES